MAGSGSLPLAGVEMIVQNLSEFQSDIKKANSALGSLQPRQTLLQKAFSGAWEMVKGFGREVLNVAEYALGHLLADAFQWVTQKVWELVDATIEAGSEFQTLEIRLNRLNLNDIIESQLDYVSATDAAILRTKEQLNWLQKLAATTPYDNADITRTYTLARSYNFADQEARDLTEDIVNFASGMGLGNTEIERIIVNFGQMVQQGKVTQRELNDLARGSFVPVNDVLKKMSENTGVAMENMDDFRKKGESVGGFMKAFSQVVEERFAGAAEQMAKTFKAASDNALDVVKSIGGLHVVKPILDVVGARIAAFVSAFTDDPKRWDRMVNAAKGLGTAISGVVSDLFGLLPSSESVAESVVSAVENMSSWVRENGPEIVEFFRELAKIAGSVADTIQGTFFNQDDKGATGGTKIDRMDQMSAGTEAPFGEGILEAARRIADFINGTLIPALDRFFSWIDEHEPLFLAFGDAVGDIFSDLLAALRTNLEAERVAGAGSCRPWKILCSLLSRIRTASRSGRRFCLACSLLLRCWGRS